MIIPRLDVLRAGKGGVAYFSGTTDQELRWNGLRYAHGRDARVGSAWTVSLWIKPNSAIAGINAYLFTHINSGVDYGTGSRIYYQNADRVLSFNGSNIYGSSTATIDYDAWQHWVIVDRGDPANPSTNYVFYKDGVVSSIYQYGGGSDPLANPNAFCIGNRPQPEGTDGAEYEGYMAHFALWRREILPSEAFQLSRGKSPLWYANGIHMYAPLTNPAFTEVVNGRDAERVYTEIDPTEKLPVDIIQPPWLEQQRQIVFFSGSAPPEPINITPGAAVAGADSTNPTTRQGSINYGPAAVVAGADTTNPTVQLGNINITPSPSVIVTSRSGPQVFLSSVSVAPNAIAAKAARSDPLVLQGHITLDIDSATAVADGVDPTVGFSGVTATPSPAVAIASTTDPIVDDYANITPQPAPAGTAVVAPTLYWGTQSASPGPASAGTMAINPQDLVMYAVTASATAEDPIVYVGDAVIGAWPEPATSSTESVGPDLFFSSHSTTQDPAAASAVGVDPSYHVYDAPAIWPSPAVADTANAGPSVSQSSLLISPDVAECATETIEPDYFYTSMSVDPDTAEAKGATTVDVVGVFFRYFLKADINRGEYTDENDGITDIYQSIDEDPADDDDYIKSDWGPEEDKYLGKLQGVSEPDVDTSHYLEYRYRKDNNLSRVDIIVRIYQDDTVITGWTHEDIGTEYVTQRQLLAEEDAALITDYGKLRIEIEASEV